MRIVISQLNYRIGDVEGNVKKMVAEVQEASKNQADLIVFSELAISGYPPKDLLDYPSFIKRCENGLEALKELSSNIGILVGAPVWSNLEKGKRLYNSALFYYEGKLIGQVDKSLLPTYDIFDEYRYFEPAKEVEIVTFKNIKLAITICEDLWNLGDDRLYDHCPMDSLIKQSPDLMINLSGSPYSYNHMEKRRQRMQENAAFYNLPLVYVNQVGGNTDILFDGGSMLINAKGEIVEECLFFEEDSKIIEWEAGQQMKDEYLEYKDYEIHHIHTAIVMGLKDYFNKSGLKTAILGSSGGIDSAVVNALAVEALGPENVHAILMPSPYSSKGSVDDAVLLAQNLGCKYDIIAIKDLFNTYNAALSPLFQGLEHDVTEENLQARIRGVLLMAVSNKFGNILLNTSNKSESAVGYSTLYGDLCGGFSPIGDLYKGQVYAMAKHINRISEIIPNSIINKPPSAELRPDQKDSDSLPPYDFLDKILFHYIEEQKGWQEIVDLGFDEIVVRKIVKLVDRNEFKRFQAPPSLRISHKAFGFGRRMPIVGQYFN